MVSGDATTASIVFNDYCDSGITMAGTVSVTTPSGYTTGMTSLTLTITMNMLVRDNSSGLVYKVDNYSMVDALTLDGGNPPSVLTQDLQLNGTFYDPVNGYVIVTTVTPFHYDAAALYPLSGAAVVSAGNLAAGVARVKITATGSGGYKVEFDLNGDGTYGDGTNGEPGPVTGTFQ